MADQDNEFGVVTSVASFNSLPAGNQLPDGYGTMNVIDYGQYGTSAPGPYVPGYIQTTGTLQLSKAGFKLEGDLASLFVLLANVGDGEFLECVVLRMSNDGASVEQIASLLGITVESTEDVLAGASASAREVAKHPVAEWAGLIAQFADGDLPEEPETDDEDEEEEDILEEDGPIDEFSCGMDHTWKGVLCVEGHPTGDGRYINKGALTWDESYLPQTLMAMFRNPDGGEGHAGAEIAGRIDNIWREDAGDIALIWGQGVYTCDDKGHKLKEYVDNRTMRGVSVDMDSLRGEMAESDADNPYGSLIITSARLRAATACPIPAFIEAAISTHNTGVEDLALIASGEVVAWARVDTPVTPGDDGWGSDAIVASGAGAAPVAPPKHWFDKPDLPGPIPLQVSPEGRVYGVIADKRAQHIGFPRGDRRGRPVGVPTEGDLTFGYFHNKSVLTAEGVMVPTGVLVDGGTHPVDQYGNPDLRMPADSARAYYSTLDVVADVRLYWDANLGIVAAGAVRPDATQAQIRRLRASDVSPDWRPIEGRREVVGLVTVPVSGFITPEHADQYALVASGGRIGWDFETGEPLAAIGVGMVRRDGHEMNTVIAELKEEVEYLRTIVSGLRRESLTRKLETLRVS